MKVAMVLRSTERQLVSTTTVWTAPQDAAATGAAAVCMCVVVCVCGGGGEGGCFWACVWCVCVCVQNISAQLE